MTRELAGIDWSSIAVAALIFAGFYGWYKVGYLRGYDDGYRKGWDINRFNMQKLYSTRGWINFIHPQNKDTN